MKKSTLLALSCAALGFTHSAFANTTYQVTGPVLEVTDSKIVIQKEKEKWEIARSADTKITGDIKVGSKVTIQYTMHATSVAVKADKDAKPAAAKKTDTPAPAEKKTDKKP